ncbi:MAG: formylglycine-generating enzyme family protein, partial [Planctomycetaceae bacterium]|nr:formylglycine-generating enzyme family protein [Planctomycetaceae bacterium]
YSGEGLHDIPRGDVKSLRIFSYHYAYQNMGGLLGVIGIDGPCDIKRVLATVPVHDDGSAKFLVPANTPISIQPLDREAKALQLMRSWTTAMPGTTQSCVGCHQSPQSAPQTRLAMAQKQPPDDIKPWYGSTRGFSYQREVQPVIDRYCISCHDGAPKSNGTSIPDLRGDVKLTNWRSITPGNGKDHAGKFSVGYSELHRFVRRPGIESDYHMLEPMEFHADTTELVQMLRKGHHNVKLDDEAWDRLITWIDLNCPYHGTWGEELDKPGRQRERRRELLKLYGGIDDDPESVPQIKRQPVRTILPEPSQQPVKQVVECPNWPMNTVDARQRQTSAGRSTRETIDLGNGIKLRLALIPSGEFVMGSLKGGDDERPLSKVRIEKPYWIGVCEVTNRQFNLHDKEHDSRVESKNTYQFGIHGYPVNQPEQPVVRVSWDEAQDFCHWLSKKTGRKFSLPTEAQWEYACRAGTETPFFYGDLDSDFSKFANVADAKLTEFASDPYTVNTPLKNPPVFDDWIPKDPRFNDGSLLSVAPGSYRPNSWGLHDTHGNVSEWTRTTYIPYPYLTTDGREDIGQAGRKVVRGGSWRDRPKRSTSSFRLSYQPYQRVYNVGFRVVCEPD